MKILLHSVLKLFFIVLLAFFFACGGTGKHPPENGSHKDIQSFRIQQLGVVDSVIIGEVKVALEKHYKIQIEVAEPLSMPEFCYTEIRYPRYRADSLLKFLMRKGRDENIIVIGITSEDISTTKYSNWRKKIIKKPEWKYKDFGIFGLGQCPGHYCFVSTYRYFKGISKEKALSRLRKIVIHEVGHNIGLRHCPDKTCVMTDACESISTIDKANEGFCSDCRAFLRKRGLDID